MTEPLKIVPAISDKEVADALRMKMEYALAALCEIMREGDQAGLQIAFSIGRDQYGKHVANALTIVKPL